MRPLGIKPTREEDARLHDKGVTPESELATPDAGKAMIDLNTWDLTIPEGKPATTITTGQLQKGYQSKYFKKDGSQVVFWAPVTGTTTKGSSYPRSELREAYSTGVKRNWKYTAASNNRLSARLAVEKVPSEGRIIIGQIHAKDLSAPYLKVIYNQIRGVGYVTVEARKKPKDAKSPVIMSYTGMPLGQTFTYDEQLSKKGLLKVAINGQTYQEQINSNWNKYYLYFKAGSYVTDNKGPSIEGGRVRFLDLRASH